MDGERRARVRGPVAYVGAVAVPAALTVGLVAVRPSINATDAALAYLLAILAVATLSEFGPAALACVAATLLLNFNFLPPYGTLTIADPANWFALITFLTTAAVTSRFVTTARRRSAEASARAAEASRLHELGRWLLTVTRPSEAPAQILIAVRGILVADALAFVAWEAGGPSWTPAAALPSGVRRLLPASQPTGAVVRVPAGAGCLLLLPLRGSRPPQAIAAFYEEASAIPADQTLAALASLTALALERARLLDQAMEAEVLRKSEALKSALLSSVSHDVRTPLSAARIAATALQDPAVWNDADMRIELLATLEEATVSLNRAVGNLLYMSRIEAGALNLARRPCAASEIVAAAIEVVGPRRLGERLHMAIAGDTLPVAGDAGLLGTALANLLDNALKYSPAGSPVELRVEPAGVNVRIAVLDRGGGVPAGEEEAVFTAFRRASARRPRAPGEPGGVGLGLSIVRGIVEAHGGTATINQRPGGGCVATLTLPALRPPAATQRQADADLRQHPEAVPGVATAVGGVETPIGAGTDRSSSAAAGQAVCAGTGGGSSGTAVCPGADAGPDPTLAAADPAVGALTDAPGSTTSAQTVGADMDGSSGVPADPTAAIVGTPVTAAADPAVDLATDPSTHPAAAPTVPAAVPTVPAAASTACPAGPAADVPPNVPPAVPPDTSARAVACG